jgi:hypothetical protein
MDTVTLLFITIIIISISVIVYTILTKQVNPTNIVPMALIFITLFTAYITYSSCYLNEKHLSIDMTNKLTVELYEKITNNYPYSINLFNELNGMDINNNKPYIPETQKEYTKYQMVNYSISIGMIDLISEFYSMRNLISIETYESWIETFKGWFRSKIVSNTWESIKLTYNSKIRQFIDNLYKNTNTT